MVGQQAGERERGDRFEPGCQEGLLLQPKRGESGMVEQGNSCPSLGHLSTM